LRRVSGHQFIAGPLRSGMQSPNLWTWVGQRWTTTYTRIPPSPYVVNEPVDRAVRLRASQHAVSWDWHVPRHRETSLCGPHCEVSRGPDRDIHLPEEIRRVTRTPGWSRQRRAQRCAQRPAHLVNSDRTSKAIRQRGIRQGKNEKDRGATSANSCCNQRKHGEVS
jgi:hypothetical protein